MNKPVVPPHSRIIMLASVAVILAGLYLGREILAPLAMSVLLSLLLMPLVTRLQRFVGGVPAVLLSVFIAVAMFGLLGFVIGREVVDLANRLPEYKENIQKRVAALNRTTNAKVGLAVEAANELEKDFSGKKSRGGDLNDLQNTSSASNGPVEPPLTAIQLAKYVLGPLISPLETTGIILIFTVFILIQREDLRDRLILITGEQQVTGTTRALDEVGYKVSRYLLLQSIINAAYGVFVAAGLYLIGVPDAAIWGALAAVMRFIPYIGVWIAATLPILLCLASTEGWQPVYVFLVFLGLEFVVPTVFEPFIVGVGTEISPLALLVAAVFWTWLWGSVGLFLSTPLTVCLAVLGKYVPKLVFLHLMLTDRSILDAKRRFYQRLLALDHDEAIDVIEDELKQKSFVEVCDAVLVPALLSAAIDRQNGRLDDTQDRMILDTLSEFAADKQYNPGPDVTEKKNPSGTQAACCVSDLKALPEGFILCVPARDESDEISAKMFTDVLRARGYPAKALAVASLAGEILDTIAEHDADVICISAMPPAATMHARYLCKRIQARFPDRKILIGLWESNLDPKKTSKRVGCTKEDMIVTSFSDGLDKINLLIPQLVIQHRVDKSVREEAVAFSV